MTAESNDGLSDNGSVFIECAGNIAGELALEDVTNLDDYEIHFGVTVSGSSIYLKEMKVEWDNKQASLAAENADLDILIRKLGAPDAKERLDAIKTLSELKDPKTVVPLLRLFTENSWKIQDAVLQVLVAIITPSCEDPV